MARKFKYFKKVKKGKNSKLTLLARKFKYLKKNYKCTNSKLTLFGAKIQIFKKVSIFQKNVQIYKFNVDMAENFKLKDKQRTKMAGNSNYPISPFLKLFVL